MFLTEFSREACACYESYWYVGSSQCQPLSVKTKRTWLVLLFTLSTEHRFTIPSPEFFTYLFFLYFSHRYSVYEVKARNQFPLSPKDGMRETPKLQYILWAPNTNKLPSSQNNNNAAKGSSQAIAFVYENDLYYKPKVQNDLVCRITMTGIFPFESWKKNTFFL